MPFHNIYNKTLLLSTVLFLLTVSVFLVPAYCTSIVNNNTITSDISSDSSNPIKQENDKSYQFNLTDPNLKAELVATGLKFPTSMAFVGDNDILVLEKDNGTVKRIVNGQMLEKPLIDVNVYGLGENGLLGVATAMNNDRKDNITNVFLFFSESLKKDTMVMKGDEEPLGNRLYKYELVNNSLINPQLILDLPYSKIDSPKHNGGKMIIGPDDNVYVVIGDLGDHYTEAQNAKDGDPADGSSGVLVVQQNGQPIVKGGEGEIEEEEEEENVGILGDENPLNLYYAYGIRNSFGMDFDPLTGNLWITENGPDHSDEINLVKAGFNGGYDLIQGMAEEQDDDVDTNDLVDFNGKGKYNDPEFLWERPIGVTAIKFLNSTKYTEEYKNDVLVGDFNYGNMYHFELDEDREKLALEGKLSDKIAEDFDHNEEMKETIFAQGPGGIVDIQIGPDGYIYVLSLLATVSDCDPILPGCVVTGSVSLEGVIHKIVPANN
jgi:aldose sugar dehydrogenase